MDEKITQKIHNEILLQDYMKCNIWADSMSNDSGVLEKYKATFAAILEMIDLKFMNANFF